MAIIKENQGDASADTGTQYTLSLGDVFQGAVDPADDRDWIRVELNVGTIYDITLSGEKLFAIGLYDSEGNHITYGNPLDSYSKVIFNPTISGSYYVEAVGLDPSDYEISVVENTIPVGTYDDIAAFLTDGYRSRRAFDVEPGGVLTADVTALTETGQQLARWALDLWTDVIGIRFEFVNDDNAHITFSDDEKAHFARLTTVNNGVIHSALINIPESTIENQGITTRTAILSIFIHEIGHALGLGHPGPYTGSARYGFDNIFLIDSNQATVMSYFDARKNTYINASSSNDPVTPMIADIIAVQNLYGVPTDINAGDTVYGYRSNVGGYLDKLFQQWTGEGNPLFLIDGPWHSSPAFADFDGDSDPDLVIWGTNKRGTIHYYENTGTDNNPAFTQRTGAANPLDDLNFNEQQRYGRPVFVDLDGDDDLDVIVGDSEDSIRYYKNNGTRAVPSFTLETFTTFTLDDISLYITSSLVFADLDGDGDFDLVIGNDDGSLNYFENTGTVSEPVFTQRIGAANPLDDTHVDYHSIPAFTDLDGDDDLDLVVSSGNDTLYYFENIGTVTSPIFEQRRGAANPLEGVNLFAINGFAFIDLDNDGDHDLVTGGQEGDIHYLENIGTRTNPVFTARSVNGTFTLTLYDNGGNDTLNLHTDVNNQRIDLRPEGISDVYGRIGNLIVARDTIIENVIAGYGNDEVIGNFVNNILEGRDGSDELYGMAGNDILIGGRGGDKLNGGAGNDTASYAGSDSRVDVRLSGSVVNHGHATGDTLINIENLIGSAYNDILAGNGQANMLTGNAGNDLLWGSGGDDLLTGGAGADRFQGGPGIDTVTYTDSAEGVTVRLDSLSAYGGDAAGDTFPYRVDVAYMDADGVEQIDSLPDVENLKGSAHNDVLAGDRRDNVLDGGAGDDTLYGGPGGGDDVIAGGTGDDSLFGGQGADTLTGGPGDDRLVGGPGDDVLVFAPGEGADTVTDFTSGSDKIDLTAFEIVSVNEITMVAGVDGVTIDLSDIGGGSIFLLDLTTLPDAGDVLI